MKVAVLGYGVEGKVAAAYWAAQGAEVTVCDGNPEVQIPAEFETQLGQDYLKRLSRFDVIVRTPSIRPDTIAAANPDVPDFAKRITSTVREFLAQSPAPVIGVTGTKGKGTTTTLISRILEAAGKTVWVGGNIGRAPLEFLAKVKPEHYVVLELSSFQLMDVEQSPQVAVCLMMAPEHMDWHIDVHEYLQAKANLFRYQHSDDLAVYKAGDAYSEQIASASPGRRIGYGAPPGAVVREGALVMGESVICQTDEVGLVGAHNLENICAAVTATWELVGRDVVPVRQAVTSFTGLEHRLELVAEVGGVRYYDDSFSTTPETAIAAIRAFKEPKVIILGGADKGSNYDELAEAVKADGAIQVLTVGEMGPRIDEALRKVEFTDVTTGPSTMTEMVEAARRMAKPGSVVLLSPACTSFDLFKNYKDRGDQFKSAVRAIRG